VWIITESLSEILTPRMPSVAHRGVAVTNMWDVCGDADAFGDAVAQTQGTIIAAQIKSLYRVGEQKQVPPEILLAARQQLDI